ncbi:hypothetical protein D9V86_05335 [Bacteroidetes/Chlorobi group bacterium ChocPot_Mid]|jgi:MFS family permease|nr:MAG: hypothetical protein D9V86_05335 [Bacteroidetes/Chlorobi group bacterium ChocPot_Mid]
MLFTYKNLEDMLFESNRKKYLIVDFFIGRGFILPPIIMALVYSFINALMNSYYLPVKNYIYIFIFVISYSFIISLIMLYLENKILKGFKELDLEKKLKKLKILLYLNESLYFISFTSVIVIYNSFEKSYISEFKLFPFIFQLLVMIALSFLMGWWFSKSNFKKLKEEILRKGILE